jgi:hypothetical protein
VNIGYKKRALETTAHLWTTQYHETTVHWALRRRGETLFVTPDLVVEQHRNGLKLGALLVERFAWGRLFACTRARETSALPRVLFGVLAPLLPVLLLARHLALQARKRVRPGAFLRAAPLMALLLIAWSLGEAAGYITGES